MKCSEVKSQTYLCSYNMYLPWLCKFPWESDDEREPKCVSIDKCLLTEIIQLWEMGIKTTGCCCGHGNKAMAFIGVQDSYIEKMKELGYEVHFNSCRPNDEDSFIPKTQLNYKNAKVNLMEFELKEIGNEQMTINFVGK